MSNTSERNTSPARPRSLVVPFAVIGASLALVVAVVLVTTEDDVHSATSPQAQAEGSAQLPTGAGSVADGAADEAREGLFNRSQTDDQLEGSAATDLVSPMLEQDETGPPPNANATGLEPADNAEDFDVIERARQ